MTVCIAGICDYGFNEFYPKIIFCADKLVSAGVQFEGGEPKIKKITECCYILQSSNDSESADLILERVKEKVKEKVKGKEDIIKIKEIVDFLCQECTNFKKEKISKDVLEKYNLSIERLHANPNEVVKLSIPEIDDYIYEFKVNFIVCGIELPKDAHIYTVDQNGEYHLNDSSGFAAIGSGGELAFLELTKYTYSRNIPMIVSIPRIYFAKRVAERAEGVGRSTDFFVLYFGEDPQTKKLTPALLPITDTKKLDKVLDKVRKFEVKELNKLTQEIYNMLVNPPKIEQKAIEEKKEILEKVELKDDVVVKKTKKK